MLKQVTYKLTAEHRAKLEQHRRLFALRSETDAVRHLIDNYAGEAELRDRLEEMKGGAA